MAEAVAAIHPIESKPAKTTWAPYLAKGDVKSAFELLEPAGLAWEPEFAPLYLPGIEIGQPVRLVEGWRGVIRGDSKDLLGIVGDRYTLVLHEAMAEFVDAIRGQAEGKYSFGIFGHLKNGVRPFMNLSAGTHKVGNHEVESVVAVRNAHDGSLNLTAGFYSVIGKNTYSMAIKNAQSAIRIRHTSSSEQRIKEIEKIIKAAHQYEVEFDNAVLKMIGTPITDENARGAIEALIPGDSTRAQNSRFALLEAYLTAPGACPGSAFGLIQAVTAYVTTDRSTRTVDRDEEEARTEAVWFGSGKALAEEAWKLAFSGEITELKPTEEAWTVKD